MAKSKIVNSKSNGDIKKENKTSSNAEINKENKRGIPRTRKYKFKELKVFSFL
jgi:hypothetical protein